MLSYSHPSSFSLKFAEVPYIRTLPRSWISSNCCAPHWEIRNSMMFGLFPKHRIFIRKLWDWTRWSILNHPRCRFFNWEGKGKDRESGVGLVGLVGLGKIDGIWWDACWLILFLGWLVGSLVGWYDLTSGSVPGNRPWQFARQWRSICDHINWRASVGWHVFARMVWVRCWRTTWAWERRCNASVCWSIWRWGFSLRHSCGEWRGSRVMGWRAHGTCEDDP